MCTAFLLLLCVTGLPLIFEDELATLARPEHAASRGSQRPSIDRAVAAVSAAHPGKVVQFVYWPDDEPGFLGVAFADRLDTPKAERALVDLRSGALFEEHLGPTWLEVFLDLHRNLLLGRTGDLILVGVGVIFFVALISGLLVYRPFMRRSAFGTIRPGSRRLRWLDWHNLIGIATVAWAGVIGMTGIANTLEERLFSHWQAERVPALMAPYAHRPPAQAFAPLDAVIATAHRAAPAMAPTSIVMPRTPFGTPRHFIVWTHGDAPLTSRIFTPMLIDGETGALAAIEPLPWYLRAVEISRPLHYGDYGGLPLKILWAFLDVLLIVVLVTGLYLWLRRRSES